MSQLSHPPQRFQATVSGRVQGVNFRYYTRQTALRHGLTGWVRNRPDGTVSVLAEGDEAALRVLLAWLHDGPPSAMVERVEARWEDASGEFRTFSILW